MSSKTKGVKLGGIEYKKRAKVKKLKLEELKRKIPKLQTFFDAIRGIYVLYELLLLFIYTI